MSKGQSKQPISKKRGCFLSMACLAIAALTWMISSTSAEANFVTATPLPQSAHGSVWFTTPNSTLGDGHNDCCLRDATPANVPGGNADVTFTTSIINFSSFGDATNTGNPKTDFTIGSFLNSLGAVPPANQSYSPVVNPLLGGVPTANTDLLSCTPFTGCDWLTFMQISGDLLLHTGDHIAIFHDDGVSLALNGVLQPGFNFQDSVPNIELTTWNGPSGLVNFDLYYSEGVVAPAELQLAVIPAPEPATFGLFAVGLMGLGALLHKRRS